QLEYKESVFPWVYPLLEKFDVENLIRKQSTTPQFHFTSV
ncbi:MAG: hypothetical protein ACI89D_002080, partial [Bermanella sp.]